MDAYRSLLSVFYGFESHVANVYFLGIPDEVLVVVVGLRKREASRVFYWHITSKAV